MKNSAFINTFIIGPCLFLIYLPVVKGSPASTEEALKKKEIEKIIQDITFVADFNVKEESRHVSDEIFWRYPYYLKKPAFDIDFTIQNPTREIPLSKGAGRAIDHLNRGRILFLEKKFVEAKNTWLGARARYGKEYPYHKRTDYFIGMAFLQIANEIMKKKHLTLDDTEIKSTLSNAATFLSWAFIAKETDQDEGISHVTPKALYNLAAIYWKYERYSGSFGAVEKGLSYLRKTGSKDYRPKFHQIMTESYILNRTYLNAIQEIDQSIRQDPIPNEIAKSIGRAGDIYYDLNNFELANELYKNSNTIRDSIDSIQPMQLILQAESLFWLGDFSGVQKLLYYALNATNYKNTNDPIPDQNIPWATLRLADSYLARKQMDKARLEYYKLGREFKNHPAAKIARVRESCLDLPLYGGKNVIHARELLEEANTDKEIPETLKEFAWACRVASYTDRERSPEMINQVKSFFESYPNSPFLSSFYEAVRNYNSQYIYQLLEKKEYLKAISFYEKKQSIYYKKIDNNLKHQLFIAYSDTFNPAKACLFWDYEPSQSYTDEEYIRFAVIAAEIVDLKPTEKRWLELTRSLSKTLNDKKWNQKETVLLKGFITRLRNTKSILHHRIWLLKLFETWSKINPEYVCDSQFPLLSELYESKQISQSFVLNKLNQIIDSRMPSLITNDPTCAYSILDLESKLYDSKPDKLATKYLERNSWPLTDVYRMLYWTISENAYNHGDRDQAKKMWDYLIKNSPLQSEEYRYAKARLENNPTQFEQLWDQ